MVESGAVGVRDVGDVDCEPRPRPFAEDVGADVDAPVVQVEGQLPPMLEDVAPQDRVAPICLLGECVRFGFVPVS